MGLIKHHYFKAVIRTRSEQRKITLIAFRVLGEHDVATIQSAQDTTERGVCRVQVLLIQTNFTYQDEALCERFSLNE